MRLLRHTAKELREGLRQHTRPAAASSVDGEEPKGNKVLLGGDFLKSLPMYQDKTMHLRCPNFQDVESQPQKREMRQNWISFTEVLVCCCRRNPFEVIPGM